MDSILSHMFLTYFSVGSLIPSFFDLFLAYLFLVSIREKSASTFHLGMAFTFITVFNLGYFLSASFYSPLAAYHRWITVGFVTLVQAHSMLFILNLPRELSPRVNRIVTGVLYGISFATTAYFMINTVGATTIYHVTGHYYDFDVTTVNRHVAYVVQSYVVVLVGLLAWIVITVRDRKRWMILILGLTLLVVSGAPSVLNVLSREGRIDRGTYQVAWNIFNTVGFFSLSILYINYTRDRTSFMSKIVGISLVTMLLVLQGLSYYSFEDKDAAYDELHRTQARLALLGERPSSDLSYQVFFGPPPVAAADRAPTRRLTPPGMDDIAVARTQAAYTLLHDAVAALPDRGFDERLAALLTGADPLFAGYARTLRAEAARIDSAASGKAQRVLQAIDGLDRRIRYLAAAVDALPERGFRRSVEKLIAAQPADLAPFTDAIRDHVSHNDKGDAALKSDVLCMLAPFEAAGTRFYREDRNQQYIAYQLIRPDGASVYETGFSYRAYRAHLHPFSVKHIAMLFAILVIVLLFFRLFFFGALVSPLRRLIDALGEVRRGNLDVQIPVQVDDEIGFLTHNFNLMTSSLAEARRQIDDYTHNLERKVADRTTELERAMQSLWGEMQLAKKIQTVLLPTAPALRGYEIAACMHPADEVGGDYYDVITAGGREWIAIGDVSGHGVPAGLIMMMVQTSIRVTLEQNPAMGPRELLTIINGTITDNIRQLGEDKYMTLSVFAVHEAGAFVYSGLHQDLLVWRSATGGVETWETKGLWLGLVPDIAPHLTEDRLTLADGDTLLLYTDGVTEARAADDRMFTQERLVALLAEIGGASAESVRDRILAALEGYQRADDVTILVVKKRRDS